MTDDDEVIDLTPGTSEEEELVKLLIALPDDELNDKELDFVNNVRSHRQRHLSEAQKEWANKLVDEFHDEDEDDSDSLEPWD